MGTFLPSFFLQQKSLTVYQFDDLRQKKFLYHFWAETLACGGRHRGSGPPSPMRRHCLPTRDYNGTTSFPPL